MDDQLLRRIPKVDELLRDPLLAGCCRTLPQQTVTQAIRQALEELRREILAGTLGALPERPELCRKIADLADRAALPSLRNVINGTGIVLHTNLGRACLSEQAARAAWCAARDYSTLEYDLKTGSRGLRYAHVEGLLCRLTGAESALVVNNNASAVLRNIAGSGDHQQDPFAGLCRCHRPGNPGPDEGTYQQLPHCGLYGSTAAFRADGIGPQPRPARR